MRNVVKELNDRSPSEVRTLDEEELRRFEALCECWSKIAEAELARRRALPRSQVLQHRNCVTSSAPLVVQNSALTKRSLF
jgi:hypothetical protein